MPARLIRRKKETIYSDIIKLFFFFTPFFFGLFYEYAACICAVVLLLLLLYLIDRQKKLSIRFNMLLTALLALLAGYLLTPFWAVDSGMALLGFFKFLPAALFWLLLMQLGPEVRERLFLTIPVSGITMTLLSYPTLWIPALTPYFYASDRLGGFFQYSNSFALFLLLGIIPLAFQKKRRFLCLAGILVLLFGILATGSRTVFMLTVLIFLWLCLTRKRLRIPLMLLLAACVAAALLFVAITGNQDTIGRFLTISLESSTLMGRLLYYRDVLPVILKHPFGLGYMGYYYAQGGFQTGVYATKFVHNELLQFAVDVGWIPTLLFAFALLRRLLARKTPAMQRMLLFAICAHSMLDFDLQFLSIFFVLFLTMDPEEGKGDRMAMEKTESKGTFFVRRCAGSRLLVSGRRPVCRLPQKRRACRPALPWLYPFAARPARRGADAAGGPSTRGCNFKAQRIGRSSVGCQGAGQRHAGRF